MFIVIGFGYLALEAVLVIGPVLIPFMIVPKLDFLFWSWLKALIKYSFYPVIGNIVLLGICQLMLSILNTTLPTSGPDRYHDYPDTYLDYRVRRRPLRHLQNSRPGAGTSSVARPMQAEECKPRLPER